MTEDPEYQVAFRVGQAEIADIILQPRSLEKLGPD
jgi:hypothetical protein